MAEGKNGSPVQPDSRADRHNVLARRIVRPLDTLSGRVPRFDRLYRELSRKGRLGGRPPPMAMVERRIDGRRQRTIVCPTRNVETPDNGKNSRWYQAAVRQKAGRITAAGMTKEVTLEAVDGPVNDPVDVAYRAKYGKSPYLSPMISLRARAATVKVTPREMNT